MLKYLVMAALARMRAMYPSSPSLCLISVKITSNIFTVDMFQAQVCLEFTLEIGIGGNDGALFFQKRALFVLDYFISLGTNSFEV